MNLTQLHALGFDSSKRGPRGTRIACSRCRALVVQGMPMHETGCPNAKHPSQQRRANAPIGSKGHT